MSDQEVKYFNVKNTSLRLVSFAGKFIAPEQVVEVVDDEEGINRATVEQDLFLEETDEESTETTAVEEKKPAAKTVKAKQTNSTAKTASGSGWTQK